MCYIFCVFLCLECVVLNILKKTCQKLNRIVNKDKYFLLKVFYFWEVD